MLKINEMEQPSSEEELAELLTNLVERYEAEYFALPEATPEQRIHFLPEQHFQSVKDLWPVLGGKGTASDILAGKRRLGPTTAAKLGNFLSVPPELFIIWK